VLSWFFSGSKTNLTSTVVEGTKQTLIPGKNLGSNPGSPNYAYSVWFNIADWSQRYGEYKVLFARMGTPSNTKGVSVQGINGLDPCPSVIFDAYQNTAIVSIGCYPGNGEPTVKDSSGTWSKASVTTCTVSNIPIQKWTNMIISVYGRTLDVYLNGKLVKTCLLGGSALVNPNADVSLTPGGGFSGWTSRFQYFPNAIDPQAAWNIYESGWGSSILGGLLGMYTFNFSVLNSDGNVVVQGSV